MNTRNILYTLGIVLMLVFCSCEREEINIAYENDTEDENAILVSVPCNFKVVAFGSETTDPIGVKGTGYTDNESKIVDFWLIQFSSNGKLLASTFHAADLVGNYVQMNDNDNNINNTATVWIVANTGDAQALTKAKLSAQLAESRTKFGMGSSSSDLQVFEIDGYKYTTHSESDVMTLNRSAGNGILLSGKCSFSATDMYNPYSNGTPNYNQANKGLDVTLSPMVAKLNIKYTFNEFDNNSHPVAIRFHRVPDRVSFCPGNVSVTNYEHLTYEFMLPSRAYDGDITMYVPQNKQSKPTDVTGDWTAVTKTKNAPPKASYLSYEVKRGDEYVNINVYPGGNRDGAENSFDNYEICANTLYNENITVNASSVDSYLSDTKSDARVIEKLKIFTTSNCYILNPLTGRNGTNFNYAANREEYYALPLIARVNEAWTGVDNSKTIGENDEWKVEVIWQDTPGRLVYLVESSGLKAWENSGSVSNLKLAQEYYGKGNGDNGYVGIYVTKECTNAQKNNRIKGNVLIGLRKKTSTDSNGNNVYGDIIWSWHLWITDYNPDVAVGKRNSQYNYNVPGDVGNGDGTRDAKVFHYKFWTYNGRTDLNQYEWIMDRHLGSMGWRPQGMYGNSNTHEAYGLYYQWGRKDPFPGKDVITTGENISNQKRYTITGELATDTKYAYTSGSAGSMANTVAAPTKLASDMGSIANTGRWNNTTSGYPNSAEYKAIHGTKSINDPCPAGWEVPESDAYSGNPSSYTTNKYSLTDANTWYKGFVESILIEGETNINTRYASRFYDINTSITTDQANFNNGGWEIKADGESSLKDDTHVMGTANLPSTHGANYTYFPCSGFYFASGNKDMRGLGDTWCADDNPNYSTLGRFLYLGRADAGNPIIQMNFSGSVYFNKSLAFSVRCVRKK